RSPAGAPRASAATASSRSTSPANGRCRSRRQTSARSAASTSRSRQRRPHRAASRSTSSNMMGMERQRPLLFLIVLSGLIISLCMGLRQSLGLFMRPMGAEVGITAAAFGFSIALQNIVWGLAQPFAGAAADRHGPRPVIVVTALLFAAGLLLLIVSHSFPGGLVLAGLLLGLGTTGFSTLYGAINRRTPAEKRSQTVGLVAAAGSLGTMVLAPFGGWMIDTSGWQTALVVFAVLAAAMALLALPVNEAPPPGFPGKKISLREALREALGHRGYLFMTLAFFAC